MNDDLRAFLGAQAAASLVIALATLALAGLCAWAVPDGRTLRILLDIKHPSANVAVDLFALPAVLSAVALAQGLAGWRGAVLIRRSAASARSGFAHGRARALPPARRGLKAAMVATTALVLLCAALAVRELAPALQHITGWERARG